MPKSRNPAAIVKYHQAKRRDRRRFRILLEQLRLPAARSTSTSNCMIPDAFFSCGSREVL